MSDEIWEWEETPEEENEVFEEESAPFEKAMGLSKNALSYSDSKPNQEDDLEDDTELLTNARLRLEQGKLYEMLLNHDLFASVDADARAIKNVQKEIKNFIKERLEVLLGLKPDPKLIPQIHQVNAASLPFSDLEIELLKRFLIKMSKGATEKADHPSAAVTVAPAKMESRISPLSNTQTKNSTIKPITKNKPVIFEQPKNSKKEPPSQIKIENQELKKILEEEFGEYEMPLGGPIDSVPKNKLAERNRRIALRQAARKADNPNKAPPLTPDQEEMLMTQHVASRNQNIQKDGLTPLSVAIAKALQKG
jgi:hypothetical protein